MLVSVFVALLWKPYVLCMHFVNISPIFYYLLAYPAPETADSIEQGKCLSLTHVWLFVTPRTSPRGSSVHGIFQGKNTGVGCCSFLQGIFPNQGSNPGSPALETDSLSSEPAEKPLFSQEVHLCFPGTCPALIGLCLSLRVSWVLHPNQLSIPSSVLIPTWCGSRLAAGSCSGSSSPLLSHAALTYGLSIGCLAL